MALITGLVTLSIALSITLTQLFPAKAFAVLGPSANGPFAADPIPITTKSIRAVVSIQNSKIYLQPILGQVALTNPLPVAASIGVRTSLLNLKTGDTVVVAGELQDLDGDSQFDQLAVQAIESVGLKAVLGTWRSDRWDVIRFEDFNRVSLYRPRFGLNRFLTAKINGELSRDFDGDELADFAKLRELNYTLAPEQGSSYSIFLVETKVHKKTSSVYVGRLKVEGDVGTPRLMIEIFNPETGDPIETMSLSPISSRL